MRNLGKEVIHLIKIKLREKGWNSTDLANRIGMHPGTVAKMLASDQIKPDCLN